MYHFNHFSVSIESQVPSQLKTLFASVQHSIARETHCPVTSQHMSSNKVPHPVTELDSFVTKISALLPNIPADCVTASDYLVQPIEQEYAIVSY